MYYQNYEDYMRTVLGYPVKRREEYIPLEQNYSFETRLANAKELENCYPEIYRVVNPIVCEVCNKYNGNYTRENIDIMVDEVYKRVNLNNEINIKINLDNRIDNRTQEKEINRNSNLKANTNINCNRVIEDNSKRNAENENNRQIRPNNNPFLNDLIRILILNQILGGGGFLPGRPPRPRPPVRPPIPPVRPPFPGGPRQLITEEKMYNDYFKF